MRTPRNMIWKSVWNLPLGADLVSVFRHDIQPGGSRSPSCFLEVTRYNVPPPSRLASCFFVPRWPSPVAPVVRRRPHPPPGRTVIGSFPSNPLGKTDTRDRSLKSPKPLSINHALMDLKKIVVMTSKVSTLHPIFWVCCFPFWGKSHYPKRGVNGPSGLMLWQYGTWVCFLKQHYSELDLVVLSITCIIE